MGRGRENNTKLLEGGKRGREEKVVLLTMPHAIYSSDEGHVAKYDGICLGGNAPHFNPSTITPPPHHLKVSSLFFSFSHAPVRVPYYTQHEVHDTRRLTVALCISCQCLSSLVSLRRISSSPLGVWDRWHSRGNWARDAFIRRLILLTTNQSVEQPCAYYYLMVKKNRKILSSTLK